jgi:hypothetical protein
MTFARIPGRFGTIGATPPIRKRSSNCSVSSALHVSLLQKDVPHGRYLDVDFADGTAATIVLDQGFGAWAPPRQVTVRYEFAADATSQVRRLATLNAILQRRGIGKTYLIALHRP